MENLSRKLEPLLRPQGPASGEKVAHARQECSDNGTPICVDCGNSSELCICQYDGCLWCGEPLEFCDCYELEGDLP